MEKSTLSKMDLPKFIEVLFLQGPVYAPVKEGDLILFKRIQSASEIKLEFLNSDMPPKALLFPQTETLFRFVPGKKGKVEAVETSGKPIVIFGIRPCDAKSFSILDRVFNVDYEDPYYTSKKNSAVLIGLSCSSPGTNCFCTSFDDSPASAKNVDILLTDLGNSYYVEVATLKGKQLLKATSGLLKASEESTQKKKEEKEKAAIAKISRRQNTKGIPEILDRVFENPFWKAVASKCVGCGICTYLCPTCHCFDIQDEPVLTKGGRVRVWDTCMNPEYTLQASGYNPRPSRTNRVRNRIYHKYDYFPKNYGVFACVGCGRCIEKCPVNIDIIDVLTKVGEMKQ